MIWKFLFLLLFSLLKNLYFVDNIINKKNGVNLRAS